MKIIQDYIDSKQQEFMDHPFCNTGTIEQFRRVKLFCPRTYFLGNDFPRYFKNK